jgi:hypothetical protein
MTHDDEGRRTPPEGTERPESEAPRDAAAEREPGRVPAPAPEEAPELLGERSDYPIAWEGESES